MEYDVLGQEYILDKKEDRKITSPIADFHGLTEAEAEKKLVSYFREVFGSEHGKIVLGAILEDLYYFSSTPDDKTAALCNYAKTLLSTRLGINNNIKIVDALLTI